MQKTYFILLCLIFSACKSGQTKHTEQTVPSVFNLVDKNATAKTLALYQDLKKISKTGFLYGHQDDLAYGVGWWNEEGRSDVKDVCGSYPAVFGWDLGNLGNERNLDSVLFSDIQKWIVKVDEAGGINTMSWHMDNPVNLEDSWDKTKSVYSILPGGEKHQYYKNRLKTFANFNAPLVNKLGEAIPIIFRPFHEQNGSWFWWGKGHCTVDEYKSLWQFTINYLRDSLNMHNLIYAYSPDGQFNDYLERYPGDDFVDILGVDYYFRNNLKESEIKDFTNVLINLTNLAKAKNKVAILSETGYESIKDSLWHTKAILNPVKSNKDKIEIAYMLTWRNANTKHHYAPYKGHASAEDFKTFYNDTLTRFLKNIN